MYPITKDHNKTDVRQTKKNMYMAIIFFFISLIIISLLFLLTKHRSHFSYPNLPPGKVGFPLIGESLSFLSAGRQGHPEKFVIDRIGRFSSCLFKTHIFGSPTAVVTGASGNRFLFTNENKLVVSWWPDSVNKIFPSSTETSSKEEAKKLRSLLMPFLKPEALRRYVGVMDEIADRHFQTEWANKDQLIVFPLTKEYVIFAFRLLSYTCPYVVSFQPIFSYYNYFPNKTTTIHLC